MRDNEIVKALRSWLEEIRKARQAYLEKVNEEHYPSMRYEYLLSDTIHEINLHEINRLQTENDNLKDILYDADGVNLVNYWHQQCKIAENGCKNFGEENKNLKAEIEELKLFTEIKKEEIAKLITKTKAEAYKEFAESVKCLMRDRYLQSDMRYSQFATPEDIDNLLKKLVEQV